MNATNFKETVIHASSEYFEFPAAPVHRQPTRYVSYIPRTYRIIFGDMIERVWIPSFGGSMDPPFDSAHYIILPHNTKMIQNMTSFHEFC